MRQLILLISVIAIMTSCGGNAENNESPVLTDNGFTITGTLTNIPNQTLYLQKIGKGQPIDVDSAIVDVDGNFELAGSTLIPDIFIIKINNSNVNLLLVNKGEKIELTGDGQDLKHFTVKGSPQSEDLVVLNNSLDALQDKLDSLSQLRAEYMADETKKQMITGINNEAQGLIDTHKSYLKSFITDNSSSLASIAALYQQIGRQRILTLEQDEAIYTLADKELMANYPTSIHVQNLHAGIANYKKQADMAQAPQSAIGVGTIAPDINLPTPSGDMLSLHSFRGKYVLLDFWAAWCSPCRRENPHLVSSYNKYNSKGFEIFQVSLDKTKGAWVEAIAKDNLTWKSHVSDLKYWESAPAKVYGVRSIPSNFLINPEGEIIAVNLRGKALDDKLAEVLGK